MDIAIATQTFAQHMNGQTKTTANRVSIRNDLAEAAGDSGARQQ
jgi:hypothetical protein